MKKTTPLSLVGSLCMTLLVCQQAYSAVWYVDIDRSGGAKTGTNWVNAFTNPQAALAVAVSGADEIWVAEGIYKPGTLRTSTFQLEASVPLYGGFVGNETSLTQRDFRTHLSILSGDVLGNDRSDDLGVTNAHPNRIDNVYHVVTGENTATIDGFIIVGGYANISIGDPEWEDLAMGGGIYCGNKSPVIRNCTFVDNFAYCGGAIAAGISPVGASPTIEDCIFSGNWSGVLGAAGFFRGTPTITRCIFVGGYATDSAGAIDYAEFNSRPPIVNSLFAGNRSEGLLDYGGGGAIRCNGNTSGPSGTTNRTQLINCTLSGNVARYGGAIFVKRAMPRLTNCIAWGDAAMLGGHEEFAGTIAGSFDAQYSDIMGGGGTFDGITITIGNGINDDPMFVGGPSGTWTSVSAYNYTNRTTTLTVSGTNWVSGRYSGLTIQVDADAARTDVWKQLYIKDNSSTSITVYGDATLYAAAGEPFKIWDYRLSPFSPCAEKGFSPASPTNDLDRMPRPVGKAVDMGAYELPAVTITLATVPTGLQVILEGVTNVSPWAYECTTGKSFTVQVSSPQSPSAGTNYNWLKWSDGGAQAHSIVATNSRTITASFTTQYLWSVGINPPGGGSVNPGNGQWYQPGTSFTATATPGPNWSFVNWTGDLAGSAPAQPVTMNGAKSVTANFHADGEMVTIATFPTNLLVVVDGSVTNGGTVFSWNSGTVHTVSIQQTVQYPSSDHRATWTNWSDGGAQSHTITVDTGKTVVARFTSEYQWNWDINYMRSGSVSPASGAWYTNGASFTAIATPGGGWRFGWWTGSLSGTNTNAVVTMTNAFNVVANFDIPPVPDVIYVDADAAPGGDGSTWLKAYNALYDGLWAASDGKEVWVAEGLYLPGASRDATFSMVQGVAVYGGFAGREDNRNERDYTNNTTMLSGDLLGNDTPVWGNREDNVYHVVSASSITSARLDGFVIRGGNASVGDAFTAPSMGAGMLIDQCGGLITVTNCIFADNFAFTGGALSSRRSALVNIGNCVFSGNKCTDDTAGSDGGGGAIRAYETTNNIIHSTICGNTAPFSVGGGLSSPNGSHVVLRNSLVAGNSSGISLGGGMYMKNRAFYVTNCTFNGNYPEAIWHRDCSPGQPLVMYSILWRSILDNKEITETTPLALVRYSDINDLVHNPLPPLSTRNTNAPPVFAFDTNGHWSIDSVYTPSNGTTLLTDSAASWESGALKGALLTAETGSYLQFYVKSNTRTTITVWGDASEYGHIEDPYRIIDYHLYYSSPCIDVSYLARAPGDPIPLWNLEPDYPAGYINMGHHGNTPEAATTNPPPPDLDGTVIQILGNTSAM